VVRVRYIPCIGLCYESEVCRLKINNQTCPTSVIHLFLLFLLKKLYNYFLLDKRKEKEKLQEECSETLFHQISPKSSILHTSSLIVFHLSILSSLLTMKYWTFNDQLNRDTFTYFSRFTSRPERITMQWEHKANLTNRNLRVPANVCALWEDETRLNGGSGQSELTSKQIRPRRRDVSTSPVLPYAAIVGDSRESGRSSETISVTLRRQVGHGIRNQTMIRTGSLARDNGEGVEDITCDNVPSILWARFRSAVAAVASLSDDELCYLDCLQEFVQNESEADKFDWTLFPHSFPDVLTTKRIPGHPQRKRAMP